MFIGQYVASFVASTAAYCACQACQWSSRELMTQSARLSWSILFFLSLIQAWVLRDFAKPLLEKIPWIVRDAAHFEFDDKWFGQQAVYRVSLGNFLLFFLLSITMAGVKTRGDARAKHLHHGPYFIKLLAWLVATSLPFLLPNGVVDAYASVARFGSGVFLIIQMIILLDFVQVWNETWVGYAEEDSTWYYWLLGATLGAAGGSVTLAGLMYHWFKPGGAGSCSLNVGLITAALLVVLAFTALSLHPLCKKGSIFPSAVIGLYCMYLCFSSLQSEPKDYECNGLAQKITAASGSTLALGMIVTLGAVVYAAFRAGSNTSLFMLDSDEEEAGEERLALLSEQGLTATSAGLDGAALAAPGEQEAQRMAAAAAVPGAGGGAADDFQPVSYNYSFFHFIFALASMYIAMLMTGWGSSVQDKDRIDVGWTSVWVKTGALWLTAALYVWTLIAPAVFPDRDFA